MANTRALVNSDTTVLTKIIDGAVLVCSFVAPAMIFPQAYQIWGERNVQGVSLLTWGSFCVVSAIWMAYGVKHNNKVLVLAQGLLFIMNLVVSLGVIVYSNVPV
jgi:uncharacterized protein with PQ loop repeat